MGVWFSSLHIILKPAGVSRWSDSSLTFLLHWLGNPVKPDRREALVFLLILEAFRFAVATCIGSQSGFDVLRFDLPRLTLLRITSNTLTF